jgi:hypothetical protein
LDPRTKYIPFELILGTVSTKITAPESNDLSTLIVYAYAPGSYRDENLKFFVRKGGIVDDPTYQYVFIASGASWTNLTITKDILRFQNVKLMERENTGYDSCAWKQVLTEYGMKYARFILLNGSGRGPFLTNSAPVYWPELFLKPFENSTVGLSGSTFNCDRTHIQSNVLGFTRKTYQIIYDTLGCWNDKLDVINKAEVAYSNNVLNAGYNLFVMMLYYKGHDFTDKEKTAEKCKGITDDIYYPGKYFGIDYNPLEVIFIKTNRKITPKVIENYSLWALESNKFQ